MALVSAFIDVKRAALEPFLPAPSFSPVPQLGFGRLLRDTVFAARRDAMAADGAVLSLAWTVRGLFYFGVTMGLWRSLHYYLLTAAWSRGIAPARR